MAWAAGELNYRYRLQAPSTGSTDTFGAPVRTWATEATLWGGRKALGPQGDRNSADSQVPVITEQVPLRARAGITTDKRLVRLRDQTTITGAINASVTTVTIAAALKFDGGNIDYLEIDSEILRVTAGGSGTTLTVERGAKGTTAASHSSGADARRVEVLEIVAVERADERDGDLLAGVRRDG